MVKNLPANAGDFGDMRLIPGWDTRTPWCSQKKKSKNYTRNEKGDRTIKKVDI